MRYLVTLVALLCIAGGAQAERQKISVAASFGVFVPTSGATRDQFSSTFKRISITSFDPIKPKAWRFIAEGADYSLKGNNTVELLPITFGAERGIGGTKSIQPYVTLRVGPYYGKVQNLALSVDERHIGANLNATLGLVFRKRIYTEARYDFFTNIAGTNFSGVSLSAGVKLFDLKF